MSGFPLAKGIKLKGEQGPGAPVTHRKMGWSRRCHAHHLRWSWLLTQKVGFMDTLGTLSLKGALDRDMEFWPNVPGGL